MTDTPEQKAEPFTSNAVAPYAPPFTAEQDGEIWRVLDGRGEYVAAFDWDLLVTRRIRAQWLAARLNHPEQANASPESVEGEREALIQRALKELADPDDLNLAGRYRQALYIVANSAYQSGDLIAKYAQERLVEIDDSAEEAARSTPKPALAMDERQCSVCDGVGYFGHPDDGQYCKACKGTGYVACTPSSDDPKPAPGDAAKRAAEEIDALCYRAACHGWGPRGVTWHRQHERIAVILADLLAQHTAPVLTEEEREEYDWAAKFCSEAFHGAVGVSRVRRLLAIITRITGSQHG